MEFKWATRIDQVPCQIDAILHSAQVRWDVLERVSMNVLLIKGAEATNNGGDSMGARSDVQGNDDPVHEFSV